MKRFLACLLKLAGMLALLGAAAYAVAVNWERIAAAAERLKDALTEWKLCACRHEEDDYADFTDCADWEEGC